MQRLTSPVILLIGFVLVLLLSQFQWSENLNHYSFDFLIGSTKLTSNNNNIVVIGIDDNSLNRFEDPLVLWHKYLATIIDGVAGSGAKAVALDIIPSISLDQLAPELDRGLIQAMKKSRDKGTPVYLGFKAAANGPIPHRKFIFASSGMGFLNLQLDSDRRVRKQKPYLTGKDGRKTPALSSMMYKLEAPVSTDSLPNEIYIDYRLSMPSVISFEKAYDLIADQKMETLESLFKDKLVFIGATSFNLFDIYSIPVKLPQTGHDQLAGVMIHSMSTATLLSGSLLRDVPAIMVWSITLLLSLISGVLFLSLSPKRAVIMIAGLLALTLAGTFRAFLSFWVMPVTLPVFALLIPGLIAGTYKYSVEYNQFRRLQHYFKSYVNEDVMQNIIDNPSLISLEGQHVVVSVMFADIRNFTTISEQMNPKDVVTGLNCYFAEMTKSVIGAGGYLNRYMGDGVLAIFGDPQRLPGDGALAAVQCGTSMLKNLERLNESGIFPGVSEKLKIGIGIHTGEVIAGNIGCYEKMDYSVIGDTVNLASRIETATKKYNIPLLISEATYAIVKDKVEARFVSKAKIKGRVQEVKLYEILSIKGRNI